MILKIFQPQLELCVCQIAEGLRRASGGGGGRIDSTRLQSANECQIHLLVLKLPKKKNAISTFRQDAGFYHLRNIFFRGKTLKCHKQSNKIIFNWKSWNVLSELLCEFSMSTIYGTVQIENRKATYVSKVQDKNNNS